MNIILLSIILFLLVVHILLTLFKKKENHFAELKEKFVHLDAALSKINPLIRDEFGSKSERNQGNCRKEIANCAGIASGANH